MVALGVAHPVVVPTARVQRRKERQSSIPKLSMNTFDCKKSVRGADQGKTAPSPGSKAGRCGYERSYRDRNEIIFCDMIVKQ